MADQVITYQTAKLAQQKGFPAPDTTEYIPVYNIDYTEDMKEGELFEKQGEDAKLGCGFCVAVTQTTLQTWLRDKMRIMVLVSFYNDGDTWEDNEFSMTVTEEQHYKTHDTYARSGFKTYELALETAIYLALNLLPDATF